MRAGAKGAGRRSSSARESLQKEVDGLVAAAKSAGLSPEMIETGGELRLDAFCGVLPFEKRARFRFLALQRPVVSTHDRPLSFSRS